MDTAEPSAARETDTAQPDSADFVVSVVGAGDTSRARAVAGGISCGRRARRCRMGAVDGADLIGLNLARRVADGDQIVVGIAPPQPVPQASGIVGAQTPGDAPPEAGGPVDLNTADETALDALPGVGPVTAAAIVSWRDTNGSFTDVEQLGEVDGIGPARLARLRELVTV